MYSAKDPTGAASLSMVITMISHYWSDSVFERNPVIASTIHSSTAAEVADNTTGEANMAKGQHFCSPCAASSMKDSRLSKVQEGTPGNLLAACSCKHPWPAADTVHTYY